MITTGTLSVINGPWVESTFNVIADVIGVRSARINVHTNSSVETINYALKACQTTAVKMF